MRPDEWRKARVYDPDYDHPDQPPRPAPDRLSPWLAVAFWMLAALLAGCVLGYAL